MHQKEESPNQPIFDQEGIDKNTFMSKTSGWPFSEVLPELLQRHLIQHIEDSGISVAVARERGYRSVLGTSGLADLVNLTTAHAYAAYPYP